MRLVAILVFASATVGAGSSIQTPVQGQAATIRVLKISAGPSGADKNGVFTLAEERSIFSRTADREVIVFFQWEGSTGLHQLAVRWRSPDGSVSSTSTIDYVAKDRRFGAYWPLFLSSTIALGTWSIEATVDGQPAGRYTFEIRDEKVETPIVRAPLTATEIYERLNRCFVVIERTGAARRPQPPAGGCVLSGGRIYTSASALDEVEGLQIVLAGGSRHPISAIQAWSRADGWAILLASGVSPASLDVAAAEATKIGDRLFTIEGSEAGSRLLRQGVLSGDVNNPTMGRRLLVSFPDGGSAMGSPVVDEWGELVGMIGGPPVAGATTLFAMRLLGGLGGHSVIPFTSVRPPRNSKETSVAALQAAGELALPLTGEEHVLSGGFARGIIRSPAPRPSGQSDDFSIADKQFVVFVNWTPVERLRGETRLVVYDAANRLLVQSPPRKANFRKGEFAMSYWDVPVPGAPGIYRADALFNDRPIWRGFVRITP